MVSVYLAGPDVFLADGREIGRRKVELCAAAGLKGMFPLDKELSDPSDPFEIFAGNIRLMQQADAGLFNLTPFHGAGADVGTAFELGYMHALGKPVVAYTADEREFAKRVASDLGPLTRRDGALVDRLGHDVENFGLADNLMLAGAVRQSGAPVICATAVTGPPLAALDAFDLALSALADLVR